MKSSDWKIILSDYVDRVPEWAKELDVEFPFYMPTYTEALSVILKNISYNQEIYQKKKEEGTVFIGAGSEHIDLDKSNIFAFIGERGSGKTTALYEFCKILYHYEQKADKWKHEVGFKRECNKYRFYVMEPIDASVLENKEDLMEVILASMYQVFQEKVKGNKNARSAVGCFMEDLVRSFDEVYKAYVSVGNLREQKINGEVVLAKLMNTSNSLKTKLEIEKLTSHFLRLLDGGDREGKSCLIITIDDLDLNLENGYEMLEQLHKYLANQNVIVLITVKYEQMKMICEKHIVDCLVPEFGGIHKEVYERFDLSARKISNDYLLKVLPLTNRIYLPEKNSIDKKALILQNSDGVQEEGRKSIKEFVLQKVAGQMRIYYDAKGVKKHFCLPDTVRELAAYNDFLDSLFPMNEIERESGIGRKERMLLYDQNHERFNKDIENRMAIQILNEEQIKLYRLIMARDIKRRARYTVEFLKQRMRRLSYESVNKSPRLRDSVDEQDYYYADLLETLYKLGRANYDEKSLVHCLLASFTSEMTREYYCYRYGDGEEQRSSEERLKEFLGKTFGGKWFEPVLHKMKILQQKKGTEKTANSKVPDQVSTDSDKEIQIGYISGARLKKQLVNIEADIVLGQDWEEKLIDELIDYLPCIECLILCFSNFRDASGKPVVCKWNFEFKLGEVETGRHFSIDVVNNVDSADFDIFGFIGKELTWGYEDVIALCDAYADALKKCLLNYGHDISGETEEKQNDDFYAAIRKKVLEKSIWNKWKTNPRQEISKENFGRKAVFPYYNLDMSYNIMKRVRSNIEKNTNLASLHIYDYFRSVYRYIAEELQYEQNYYKEEQGGEDNLFYDNFITSPFVYAFGIKGDNLEADYGSNASSDKMDRVFFRTVKGLYTKDDLDSEITGQLIEGE